MDDNDKRFVPFIEREEVDKEHIMKIGQVTVFFLRDSTDNGMKLATESLFKVYENRIMGKA